MTSILAFITAHMGYLWLDARFWIVGSEAAVSNGGDAYLEVESKVLRLRFTRDRGQLLLDFQPSGVRSHEWFSVDLIRRLLLGQPEASGILDEAYATFIGEHLDEIESRFSDGAWSTTQGELRRLKVKRAKDLFG